MERPDARPTVGPPEYVQQAFLPGLALAVPLLETVVILFFLLDLLAGALGPVVPALQGVLRSGEWGRTGGGL